MTIASQSNDSDNCFYFFGGGGGFSAICRSSVVVVFLTFTSSSFTSNGYKWDVVVVTTAKAREFKGLVVWFL